MFEKLIKDSLVWFPEREIGYYPVSGSPYNGEYFRKYQLYASTEMGKRITNARIELVLKHSNDTVLDVGIGSGDFIQTHGNAYGYDVNKEAICWLESMQLYRCLYTGLHSSATFWDSLEHIKEPDLAIKNVKKFVFISIPIFRNYNGILHSKHFRKNEHYWYFTHNGLINWFWENGFECVECNDMEISLGREDIGTFVFRRRNA